MHVEVVPKAGDRANPMVCGAKFNKRLDRFWHRFFTLSGFNTRVGFRLRYRQWSHAPDWLSRLRQRTGLAKQSSFVIVVSLSWRPPWNISCLRMASNGRTVCHHWAASGWLGSGTGSSLERSFAANFQLFRASQGLMIFICPLVGCIIRRPTGCGSRTTSGERI